MDKIVLVLSENIELWQKLNVAAFLSSGVAARNPQIIGENYEDAEGHLYSPLFNQPVYVYKSSSEKLGTVLARASRREIICSVYVEEMFSTNNDLDNRAATKKHSEEGLPLVGIGFFGEGKIVDKIVKGLKLHD